MSHFLVSTICSLMCHEDEPYKASGFHGSYIALNGLSKGTPVTHRINT